MPNERERHHVTRQLAASGTSPVLGGLDLLMSERAAVRAALDERMVGHDQPFVEVAAEMSQPANRETSAPVAGVQPAMAQQDATDQMDTHSHTTHASAAADQERSASAGGSVATGVSGLAAGSVHSEEQQQPDGEAMGTGSICQDALEVASIAASETSVGPDLSASVGERGGEMQSLLEHIKRLQSGDIPVNVRNALIRAYSVILNMQGVVA